MSDSKICILLTSYPDRVSRFLRKLGRWNYSHASISTDLMNSNYFSFTGKRGFIVEKPKLHPKFKGQEIQCAYFEIPVPGEISSRITELLRTHAKLSHLYKYSYIGLIMMYLRIHAHPRWENTCSGFIADVFRSSGYFSHKTCKRLLAPDDFLKCFRKFMLYEGPLHTLVGNNLVPLNSSTSH